MMASQKSNAVVRAGLSCIAAGMVLAGCASSPEYSSEVEKRMELEKMQRQAEEQRRQEREERLQERVDSLPSWALETPKADSDGLYGVGVARSDSMSAAMDKASLKADFEIAQQFRQQMSGLSKDFTSDRDGLANQEFEQVIERFVSAVDMSGQETVEQEVTVVDGKYTASVLSHLSFDRMERMLSRQNSMQGQDQMKAAFKELRERVEADQAQRGSATSTSAAGGTSNTEG